jgi:glycosyltransferase involved in cell wall biosynthesis
VVQTTPKLSAALIVKNEARCLARCLESIRPVVDEIVVVDTGSTDETAAVGRRLGAKVTTFTWVDDFSAARNFALEQTTGDWILVLDADEHASDALKGEIPEFVRRQRAVGRLKIASDFRRNGQTFRSHTFVSRLFPRGGHFEGRIHEQLVSPLPRLNLKGELWHDGYLETSKSDRNVKLLSRELEKTPHNAYLLFQLALEHTSLNQTAQACRCLEEAFDVARLDEPFAPNLIVDYLYALAELKRFETGLALIDKASAAVEDFPDFHLARGLFFMNLVRSNPAKYVSYLPKIESSFKQSLALGETEKYKSVRGSGTFLAQYNLGTLYHVFGNAAEARKCFEQAAASGYDPAKQMLQKLQGH